MHREHRRSSRRAGARHRAREARRRRRGAEALFGGARYVAREPHLLVILLVAAVAALCARSYQQILPVFAAERWHSGASGYGLLLSAGGAGALAGALGLAARSHVRKTTNAFLLSGAVLSLSLIAFASMPTLHLAAVALVVVGVSATIFTTMIATVIQLEVPSAFRGRALGLYTITLIGLPSLGSFGLAALARKIGVVHAVVAGAVVLLFALTAATLPLLRLKDRSKGQSE